MHDRLRLTGVVLLMGAIALGGCRSPECGGIHDCQEHYETVAMQIEYPDACVEHHEGLREMPSPQTVGSSEPVEYWPMTLEEAVRTALNNSQVMRDIGGMIVSAPATAVTVYDPAIRETDPRGGVEAALSAFDAQFSTGIFWGTNDLFLNNALFLELFRHEFQLSKANADFHSQFVKSATDITKVAATGTQFSVRNETFYDRSELPLNMSSSFAATTVEAEIRQPLLQGAGIEFNRIAGPGARPGMYNGVLIARVNTDINLADFEAAVRDLLNNVERAYWDLYAAYREVDARQAGRDAALETWRLVDRKLRSGTSDLEQEAQSREQYYRFDAQVINALNGLSPNSPTGQPGGAGVYTLERRLRWQLGLPASDGRLIRPSEEPSTAHVAFDWNASLQESLWRRVELRRQKWVIKRRELELTAAKNFLSMRLDTVGRYRFLGVGEDLTANIADGRTALEDFFSADRQSWELGLQLTTPIGNRIGHTAVRNAELLLARERAIYREQELRITHELCDAIAELDRAFAATKSLLNVRVAAHQHLEEIRKKYDVGWSPLEFLLDAQRRAVEADTTYYRSLVDYNLALASIHRARGSLLDYHDVYLTEGPHSEEARLSAAKQSERFRPRILNYCYEIPCPASRGVYPQNVSDLPAAPAGNEPPLPTGGAPIAPAGNEPPPPAGGVPDVPPSDELVPPPRGIPILPPHDESTPPPTGSAGTCDVQILPVSREAALPPNDVQILRSAGAQATASSDAPPTR